MTSVVPKEILIFLEKYKYKNGAKFVMHWKDYSVYIPDYSLEKETDFGLAQFVLYNDKDKSIRWANIDEQDELIDLGSV